MFLSRQRLGGWRACAALAILLLTIAVAVNPADAEAHAFLERSDPAANDVLPEAPAEVNLWYTEPLERDFSRAELYDANGQRIATESSFFTDDPYQMVLPLPSDLPNGTYTVQWRNISTADGHPQSGYVPFTIGSQADVVVPEPPSVTDFDEPPLLLGAISRWLGLLGVSTAAGALVCWFWVLRTARDPLEDDAQDRIQERIALLVLASIGVALLGSVVALVYQTMSSAGGFSLAALWDIVEGTRFGRLWIARVVLLLALAALATVDALWEDPPRPAFTAAALALCGAMFLTFSLNSHASAQATGRTTAIAVDWIHLTAASVWAGGLIALLVGMIYGTRGAPREDRREAFALTITSFTTLAIISVVILAISGLYSSWLQVGNLIALRETPYGRTLIVKVGLTIVLLGLGAVNQRVLGPRMREAARGSTHFSRTIAAEAALAVGVLFAVGLLTSMAPARDVITREATRSTFHFNDDQVHATIYISPGAAGFNQYIVDIGLVEGEVPPDTRVLLRMQSEGLIEGVREVEVPHAFGTRYEGAGSELSVTGDWQIEMIVRRPHEADSRFSTALDLPRVPPEERIPGEPPRFEGTSAAMAVFFIGLAVLGAVVVFRADVDYQDRLIGGGISLALLLAGGLILGVTRAEPTPGALATNPIPRTAQSVALGHELYLARCSSCHGPDGEGDGPLAPTLERPPANFTEQHLDVHTDGDLYWWIENGITPVMPAFGDELSDDEMWHIVNYIRSLRDPDLAGETEQGGP
ncbi:MAG TPA: copper resistance protein CopC [Thermomicrobiales bacterium]|nr:copper resistance protein CopC [Thermomicrobiales bacterium]